MSPRATSAQPSSCSLLHDEEAQARSQSLVLHHGAFRSFLSLLVAVCSSGSSLFLLSGMFFSCRLSPIANHHHVIFNRRKERKCGFQSEGHRYSPAQPPGYVLIWFALRGEPMRVGRSAYSSYLFGQVPKPVSDLRKDRVVFALSIWSQTREVAIGVAHVFSQHLL